VGKNEATTLPAIWTFEFGMSIGTLVAANVEDPAEVGEDFKCQKGQMAGIAIHFAREITVTLKTPFELTCRWRRGSKCFFFNGKPKQVKYYTGEITYVDSRHIEYDITTSNQQARRAKE
jgi:hypothetical protein